MVSTSVFSCEQKIRDRVTSGILQITFYRRRTIEENLSNFFLAFSIDKRCLPGAGCWVLGLGLTCTPRSTNGKIKDSSKDAHTIRTSLMSQGLKAKPGRSGTSTRPMRRNIPSSTLGSRSKQKIAEPFPLLS